MSAGVGVVSRRPPEAISRRAWLVWSVALFAYVVAVLQRTSLSVAGIAATHRFQVSAGSLTTLALVQLLVYAALQIPSGVAVDRWGPRRLVIVGALAMAFAQALLGLAHDVQLAMLARALLGAGDALTFVSVIRLLSAWFPAGRIPLMTQLTGLVGQTGQLMSSVPLLILLHRGGWSATFVSAGALGLLAALLGFIGLRDSPDGARPDAIGAAALYRQMGRAWREPGTRLGMWSHFACQFSGSSFTLLWGFPFLVNGEGVSSSAASRMMALFFVGFVLAGPLIGRFIALRPTRRVELVLGIVSLNIALWTVVLVWPGRAPLGMLIALVLAMAIGIPGSMIGFDFARTSNPASRLGTATGIVNIGGFTASIITLGAFGVIVDLTRRGAGAHDLAAYKVGWCVQYAVWSIGIAGVLRASSRVRRGRRESLRAGTSEVVGRDSLDDSEKPFEGRRLLLTERQHRRATRPTGKP